MFRYIAFCLCLFLFFSQISQAESREDTERWQAVFLGEKKIGYRSVKTEFSKKRVFTQEVLEIKTKVPGEPARKSKITLEYEENRDGSPLSVKKQVQSESANYVMHGRIRGGELQVTLRSQGNTTKQNFPVPDNFLMPYGLQMKLVARAPVQDTFEYSSWSFSKLAFENHAITWRKQALPESPDVFWQLSKTREGVSEPALIFADKNFVVLRERSIVAGEAFLMDTCDKACAIAGSAPLKNVYSQLIRSPYKIPEQILKKRIRYTLQSEYTLDPPATFEQKVDLIPGGARVEVCRDCGDEPSPSEAELAAALEDNFWLDFKDPVLKARVDKLKGQQPVVAEKLMTQLETFVTRHMKKGPIDYSGYASASEAYRSKSGDCTEQAVLLAALARAAGVPARVAIGLVYSNERFYGRSYVFVPHAWVQAWVGDRWASYDSGMEEFTSGHIVLGLSNGEQGKYMAVMRQLRALEITSAAQLKKNKE